MSKEKPDIYMPFFGGIFWPAVDGQPDFVIVSYSRSLWHYWAHLSCAGMPNDDGYLRRICRSFSDEEWRVVKPVVFGDYFKIDDAGLWQQKRAREEWEKTQKLMARRSIQTEKARKKRWQHNQ